MKPRRSLRYLDTVSRRRALTHRESLRLERALRIVDQGRRFPRWHPDEDDIAKEMRAAGAEYPTIAGELARSANAVAARLRHLRTAEHG